MELFVKVQAEYCATEVNAAFIDRFSSLTHSGKKNKIAQLRDLRVGL